MKEENSTTKNLAEYVFKRLKTLNKGKSEVSISNLKKFFDLLYYTSMKTEEGDLIQVSLTLIDPNNPDPNPPEMIVANRWNAIPFKSRIPLNVRSLIKLSNSADPWCSSIAVYFNEDNEFFAWGLIDQAIHYKRYVYYESDSGSPHPGLIRGSITGIGSIEAIHGFELVARLNQNNLIKQYVNVFHNSPIDQIIEKFSFDSKQQLLKRIRREFPLEEQDYRWNFEIKSLWVETLCRILIGIQNFGHGGALLITENTRKNLNIKYRIEYNRISKAISNLAFESISNWIYGNEIWIENIDQDIDEMPVTLYLDEAVTENKKREIKDELKGAIKFVSSLSRVDGLVLINQDFNVKGFGTVIRTSDTPDYIYISETSEINLKDLRMESVDHFGTRHRSMFAYCWNQIGSIGFVVSQDLEVRAITRQHDKLIMWENIQTQRI